MGVVLYAPCLALKIVTGLPVLGIILIGGAVGTIYTVMVKAQFINYLAYTGTRHKIYIEHIYILVQYAFIGT